LRILIVSATANENLLTTGLDLEKRIPVKVNVPSNHDIDVLVTGVGAVPTAFSLTRFVEKYQLIINIGIAGSYKPTFSIGDVVCVKEDTFGDYGIDDNGKFKSLFEIKALTSESFFYDNFIQNPWLNKDLPILKIPMARGITLSTASGSQVQINKIVELWNADIETMECASVFYVCRLLGIKFICFRSISNMVEPRNKSRWEMEKALINLDAEVRGFIKSLD
jgi:futalosine hydrolase